MQWYECFGHLLRNRWHYLIQNQLDSGQLFCVYAFDVSFNAYIYHKMINLLFILYLFIYILTAGPDVFYEIKI